METDMEFEIIKDKFGWILINNSKRKRLNREEFIINQYTYKIIWKKIHTHVKSLRIAITIKENLIRRIIPKYKTERIKFLLF